MTRKFPSVAAICNSPARRNALKTMVGGTAAAITGAGCSAAGPNTKHSSQAEPKPINKGPIRSLNATAAQVQLAPAGTPKTSVWAYDGTVPGTALTVRQGESLNIDFRNALPDPSTVHWHGIRIANAMDGVPHLTQPPVEPGDAFHYQFSLPDAGTYWYHPHLGTPEQVGRGLYGALIVQEPAPPAVDRDLVWLIDDWRLTTRAQIKEDFYDWGDVAFAGRIGNTVTVNGQVDYAESVSAGERIRLRLINVANARLVSLDFKNHPTWIIALDGNPLPGAVRLNPDAGVLLGPGQRADLIIDMTGEPGSTSPVIDRFSRAQAYVAAQLKYTSKKASVSNNRLTKRDAPPTLLPNEIPEPENDDRLKVKIVMDGGMMRGPSIPWSERVALRLRQWSGSREAYPSWSLNGRAHMSHGNEHPFEFVAERGQTVHLTYENRSRHWHPMHLHGHAYRELRRNGRPVPMTPWHDTSLIAPHETLEIAFVADNPGDWLLHCHILEHHAGGMGTQFKVNS
ncbi:MAG: multicopper oxidase family protein [Burkholderiaceae bacterium]